MWWLLWPFMSRNGRYRRDLLPQQPPHWRFALSFQAMSWAVAQDCQNAGEKLVLIMLANYCNSHTGRCNPSHKRLAEECSMGVSTLKRHLSRLEEARYIRVVSMASDGVSLPNQYDLIITQTEGGGSKSGWGSAQIGLGVGPNRATNLELNQEDNQKHTPAKRVVDYFPDVSPEVAEAYGQLRKRLRAPLSDIAVKGLRREARKAGMTIEAVLTLCCERSWRGFSAEWVTGKANGHAAPVHIPAGGGRQEL